MTPGTWPSRRVARAAPFLPLLRADAFNEMTFAIANSLGPLEIQTEPHGSASGPALPPWVNDRPAGALIPPKWRKNNPGPTTHYSLLTAHSIKQTRDRFLSRGAPGGLADQGRDRQHPDVARHPDRLGRLDRIGDHQLLELRGGDARDRAARQHAMRDIGADVDGAFLEQRLGGVAQGAAGIDHVIDQHAAAATHVADDVHDLGLPCPLAPLVDNGERRADAL